VFVGDLNDDNQNYCLLDSQLEIFCVLASIPRTYKVTSENAGVNKCTKRKKRKTKVLIPKEVGGDWQYTVKYNR